jgi:hypothetical protein
MDKRSGKSIVKTLTHNLSHSFWGTGVRNPEIVGIFDIRKSMFLRSKESGHHKSRNHREIETVHSGRDTWKQLEPSGKVPTRSC